MQKSLIFAALCAILVANLFEAEAACRWNFGNPGTECLMQCISLNTTNIIKEVEDYYSQKVECHTNGIWLRLQTNTYPNDTIGANWFTANVKVFQLEVALRDLKGVSADAFNSTAFRTVKSLLLENLGFSTISSGIFNGLDEVEVITIRSAAGVNRFEVGVLDALTELREFTFEQSLKGNPELNINGLTGSEALAKLEYVKIRYKLTNSIRSSTFIGLTNVKHLDLSSCQIQSIEDNSFDPISETIEELDLSGNELTTLSDGVFSMVLPNIITIRINGNKWHCDCDLSTFRLFIEQYEQNFIGAVCASPSDCASINISEAECFDDCETPTTTTTRATTTTTTMTTTTSSPPETDFMVECYQRDEIAIPDTVFIQRPIGYMSISENENGEDNLNIEYVQEDVSSVVIWFDENQNTGQMIGDEQINCIGDSEVTSIPIRNLKHNVVYSFCLMDMTSTSVSPFDCISYVKRSEQTEAVWLFESSKALTVTLVAVSLVVNIAVGMTIAFWMLNYNPFSKRNDQTTKSQNWHGFDTTARMSNQYTSHIILSTASAWNDRVNCPPLPERPSKLFEEPVYASVD